MKYEVVERVLADFEAMKGKGDSFAGQKIVELITVNGVRVVAEDGTWGLVRASSNKPETGGGGGKPRIVGAPPRDVRSDRRGPAPEPGSRRIQPDLLMMPDRTEASMKDPIVSFVMSGGVGSRLWPLSREDNPEAVPRFRRRRLDAGQDPAPAEGAADWATDAGLSDRLGAPCRAACMPSSRVSTCRAAAAIFEPVGRNTAAAVAIATLQTLAEHGDALVLVVPSDHEISTEKQFWETVEAGHAGGR